MDYGKQEGYYLSVFTRSGVSLPEITEEALIPMARIISVIFFTSIVASSSPGW